MERSETSQQRQNHHHYHYDVLDLLDEMLEDQELDEEIPDNPVPIKNILSLNYSAVDRCRDQVLISVKISQQRALSSLIVYRNYDDEPQFEPVLWYKTTLFCYVGINANQFSTTVIIYMSEYPETIESEIFFYAAWFFI